MRCGCQPFAVSVSSATGLLGHEHFKSRAAAGLRIDRQVAADGADALLDNNGSAVPRIQIGVRQPAFEWKASAVVVDLERPVALVDAKPDQDLRRRAVL